MNRISWQRVLSEGGVIVFSILLAFWIDAWWDDRQAREDEKVILTTLLAELRSIRTNLDDIRDYQVAILASTYRLVALSEQVEPDASDAEVNRLLEDQTWVASPSNFLATFLNAIIAQADFASVSDLELRGRLLALPEKLVWIRLSLQEELDFCNSQLFPYLFDNASILQLSSGDMQRPGSSGFHFPEFPVKPRVRVSHMGLLKDRKFQNLMVQRTILLEDIVSLARTPDLVQQVDEAIELIERELH